MLIGNIVEVIEEFAPVAFQESYDNTGLIIGDKSRECTGVLLTVDVTPAVVAEAVATGCNLIMSHHPLIFSGIKRLNGTTTQQKAIINAIKNDIAVYACHTSLDITSGGVSQRMASMLGLKNVKPLNPKNGTLLKLQVFVPDDYVDVVREALFSAGAGVIGDYDSCSYTLNGTGSFRAGNGAHPFVGEKGLLHKESETAIQVILPTWRRDGVEAALRKVHPYEEPAYEFYNVLNPIPETGLGAVGSFEPSMSFGLFIEKVKETFGSPIVRCSHGGETDAIVSRVALCGGSGASMINDAIACGADVYITSDVKYHDFVDFAKNIIIVDIGHHESENCTKNIFFDVISEKFPNFAIRYSQSDVNPINYL